MLVTSSLQGGCLCGGIQYVIKGRPRFMYRCYCGKCRAASGAAFVTNLIVDAELFQIKTGQESLISFESSPGKFRHFCGVCGSPIFSRGQKNPKVVSVRAGTLSHDPGVRLAYHAFVGSKAPWVRIEGDEPQFDSLPESTFISRL